MPMCRLLLTVLAASALVRITHAKCYLKVYSGTCGGGISAQEWPRHIKTVDECQQVVSAFGLAFWGIFDTLGEIQTQGCQTWGGQGSFNHATTAVDCSVYGGGQFDAGCICEIPPPQVACTSDNGYLWVEDDKDGGSSGDPHLRLAHGGRADWRGFHDWIISFVSSKDVALNVKTENASFMLGLVTVFGSFITEAHLAMRTHLQPVAGAAASASTAAWRWFNVSFWANHVNKGGWAADLVTGSCAKAGNPPMTFQLGYHGEKRCDNLLVTTDFSSATIDTQEWRFVLRALPVYGRIDGPAHRVDIELTPKVGDREFATPPHGVIGQSYDGDAKPRVGRLDKYPPRDVNTTFTTTAMAEGAIDGVAADYIVASPFETRFKFASFDYPTAPAAAAAVEAKRDAMTVADGELRSSGAVERD